MVDPDPKEEEKLSEAAKAGRAALRGRFLEHCTTLADRPDLPDFIRRVIPPGGTARAISTIREPFSTSSTPSAPRSKAGAH